MNADIIKRIVRAIADGSQDDLERLAQKVVEAERKSGHNRLANQLETILKQPRRKKASARPTTDSDRSLKELPLCLTKPVYDQDLRLVGSRLLGQCRAIIDYDQQQTTLSS